MRPAALAFMILGCMPALLAQEAMAQTAKATQVVVVRSLSPALRHVGTTRTRYVVPTTAAVPASASSEARPSTEKRVPSMRFRFLRR